METTVLVCFVTAIACALLTLDGAVCLLGVDNACVLDRASSTVMMIIGVVMLIPVAVALYTAWVDHRNSHVDERTRLLEAGGNGGKALSKRVLTYLYTSHFLSSW
ncbi:hypothetical protein Gpo141_00011767, partial [Globisporangium polare]